MIRRAEKPDENGRVWEIAKIEGVRNTTSRDLEAEAEERGFEVFWQQDDFGQPIAGIPAVPGIRITPESALLCSVVCACVRVIAETCAQLPAHLIRNLEAGGKQKEKDNPLYRLLHVAPNKRHSSFAFRELMTSWCALYGNAYAEIVRVRGQITALVPLHPSRMSVERLENKELRFRYNEPTGGVTYYAEDQIFHLSWMSSDGLVGMMPVGLARDAIQMARACEIHGIGFFANSARPSVVLETEHSIPPEAQERLREAWERVHRGPAQAGKTAILPNGLKAHELGQSNSDQQYLELRQFQIAEIARVWRVPAHLVGDLSRATFSNIESQGLDFLNYCIMPWIRRWESAFQMSVLADEPDLGVEFDVRGLMRADSATRASYYQTCMSLGIYSLNEIRELESLPPVEGGDNRFVTLNVQTLDAAIAAAKNPQGAKPPAGPEPGDAETKQDAAEPGDKEADAATEGRAAGDVDLKPTAGMAAAAKHGLRLHKEGRSGDGLKPETVARANKLARREEMNRDWVVEMNAWFKRHAADKRPGWDTPGKESPGYCAYLLWGGAAGASFSARKVAELERAGEARNCGTGAGGFQPGNKCAMGADGDAGGGSGGGSEPKSEADPFPQTKDGAAFLAARDKTARPEMFSEYTPEQLADTEMHLSADGNVGYLLTAENHLGNVFNNGPQRGAGTLAVLDAIKRGAQTLDCYDPRLPTMYARCGFVPTARIKFNDEYAPKNWDYEKNGRPDIVIMSYQGGDRDTIDSRLGTFKPYDPKEGAYVDGSDWDSVVAAARADAEPAKPRRSRSREVSGGSAGQGDRGAWGGMVRGQDRVAGGADGSDRDLLTAILDDAIKRAKLFDALRRAGVAEHELPALAQKALERYKFLRQSRSENCGTGAGGFQPGNTCAKGGDGDASSNATATESEPAEPAADSPATSNCPPPCELFAPIEDGGVFRVPPKEVEAQLTKTLDWTAAENADDDVQSAIRAYTGDKYDEANSQARADNLDYVLVDENSSGSLDDADPTDIVSNYLDSDYIEVTDDDALDKIETLGPQIADWEQLETDSQELYDAVKASIPASAIDTHAPEEFDPAVKYANAPGSPDPMAGENGEPIVVLEGARDEDIAQLNNYAEQQREYQIDTEKDSAKDLAEYVDELVNNNTGESSYDPDKTYIDSEKAFEKAYAAAAESGDYNEGTPLSRLDEGLKEIAADASDHGQPILTFRGTGEGTYEAVAKDLKPGDTFGSQGFISTSALPHFAVDWKGGSDLKTLWRIVGKSGAPVERISSSHGEKEVLYPHSANFRVARVAHNVTIDRSQSDGGTTEIKGVQVIDLVEID